MNLLAQGKKQAKIAKALWRSFSTISRELKQHALGSVVRKRCGGIFG